MPRIPDLKAIASLSRDEWETVCATLMTLLYGAHRVEDRGGKGNGLDSWRQRGESTYGWQFRRLDDRLGSAQVTKVRKNIEKAKSWAQSDLKAPLHRFTLVLNIDAEPGHLGASSEIAQLERLAEWSQSTHGVRFHWRGVSWVRAHLLEHPAICPALFEDIGAAISGAEARIATQIDVFGQRFDALANRLNDDAVLATLVREARVHFQRGKDLEEKESLNLAIQSLNDALRLIDEHADRHPQGRGIRANVLSLLCAIEVTSGRLADALRHGEAAMADAATVDDDSLRQFSIGNYAVALSRSQRFDEARRLFEEILVRFEDMANSVEIIRTRTALLEVYAGQNDFLSLMEEFDELSEIVRAFHILHGPRSETLAALGQCANAMMAVAPNDPDTLRKALSIFESVESATANAHNLLNVSARAQCARCHWLLDELEEALRIYAAVQQAATEEFRGIAADAAYNRALILEECSRLTEAVELMNQAASMYDALASTDATADARAQSTRLARRLRGA